MKNALFFFGGLIIGGAAGAGTTFFIMKRKTEDYINGELEKIERDEGITLKDAEDVLNVENYKKEEPIADLTEMANKVKSEESEKTDYTSFSKSEDDKEVKNMPVIKYVNEEQAYEKETENYEIEEMTAFSDGVLAFDKDDSKVDPTSLGIDLSKMVNDELYAVNDEEKIVYAIVGVDDTYDNLIVDEYDDEEIEDGQPEA